MGPRLLCCVALCLLGAGSLDTAVSQTPKYLVTQAGNTQSLQCEQNLGHNAMYWYKQDSKRLLKIMFSYNNKELILNDTVPSRFSPESPDKAHLNLHVKSLEPDDSTVYLCASSQDTVLQTHCLPLHKLLASQEAVGGTCSAVPKSQFSRPFGTPVESQSTRQLSSIPDGAVLGSVHTQALQNYLSPRLAIHSKVPQVLRTPQTMKDPEDFN